MSDKSGQDEVYVVPYPGPGVELTISAGGGAEPVWDRSGTEIYYRRGDDLRALSVERSGVELLVGAPTTLFSGPYLREEGGSNGGLAYYDISPTGDRFVMVEDAESQDAAVGEPLQLHVVLNWFEELRARVPTN